jgi:multidrug transporter EmrE-like cation transporter
VGEGGFAPILRGEKMAEHTSYKVTQKAISEFKELWAVAFYLYVCIGAVVLFKYTTLRQVGIGYEVWGIAAVKSLLLAKFILVGRAMRLGKRFEDQPLIWPTLYRALIFLLLLLILTTLEELLVGLLHHRPVFESLTHVVGSTFLQALSVCLMLFLILIPYSAFVSLGEVLGEREVIRLFFINRVPDTGRPLIATP